MDFSTEPEFEEKLAWIRGFVRDEIIPLETLHLDPVAQSLGLVTWVVEPDEIDGFATTDTAAAFAAFNEKRAPSFTGAWAVT